MKKALKIGLVAVSSIILAFGIFTGVRCYNFSKVTEPESLTGEEIGNLQILLNNNYAKRNNIIQNLPFNIPIPELNIWAESAILINADNGNVLYEKNANQVIPPASMTKLFAMYVVDEEVSKGNFTYDQIIDLPEESWACNMPPHSSLMFLGKDQVVTLEELLLGLSICSGNDAAYALAYTICGTMEEFVQRMNKVAEDLGLENTHFVESSGYSELNTTTAREMAEFSAVYLRKHPESLKRFHSVRSFTYPKERNLAPGDKIEAQDFSQGLPEHITMPITQSNTNPLLDVLPGCDGLKTGFIYESGYNLALTAARDGTRYISVTMKGPGNGPVQGQQGRVHDGTELMEWAFRSFKTVSIEKYLKPYSVKSLNASELMIDLVPGFSAPYVTIPFITGNSMEENLDNLEVKVVLPDYTWGEIHKGEELGSIVVSIGGFKIDEIPLVADRNLEKSNILTAMSDKIYLLFY